METYELVNRAFKHVPPPELHRLLLNRLDATPLAEFLADPKDNLQVKKLTRQHLREDPAFAEKLTQAIATAARVTPPPEIRPRKKNLATMVTSGMAAVLLALLAVLVFKPRPGKPRPGKPRPGKPLLGKPRPGKPRPAKRRNSVSS